VQAAITSSRLLLRAARSTARPHFGCTLWEMVGESEKKRQAPLKKY
jgi:hypothetical protein